MKIVRTKKKSDTGAKLFYVWITRVSKQTIHGARKTTPALESEK